MVVVNSDGSLACICHEHKVVCDCCPDRTVSSQKKSLVINKSFFLICLALFGILLVALHFFGYVSLGP